MVINLSSADAEEERLPRFLPHLPESILDAETDERPAHEIVLAHGHAARGDDHVAAIQRLGEKLGQRLLVVANHAGKVDLIRRRQVGQAPGRAAVGSRNVAAAELRCGAPGTGADSIRPSVGGVAGETGTRYLTCRTGPIRIARYS